MCGIVGLVATQVANQTLFDALTVLQHRGQDAAGIVTCQDKHFYMRKGNGYVRDVMRTRDMLNLKGNMGIGHVRYPTAGSASEAEAQPFYVNSPFGIVLAHNGNLTNAESLKKALFDEDRRHINTNSDSEVMLNVLAHALQRNGAKQLSPETLFDAVRDVHRRCRGGYAVVTMFVDGGVLAFRDPYGIRPLILGERQTPEGKDIMVASESAALTALGFTIIDDVAPGEAVLIEKNGQIIRQQCAEKSQLSPCLFEFVYFARPDSVIDNISVYNVRTEMGKRLAEKMKSEWDCSDIEVVIPIPETSRCAANLLAHQLDIEFREGFVKNRYIGRTFIMPGQAKRTKSVRQKLSVISSEFKDKNVLLIDDSIVRGTTSKEIIQMAREAGARKVYFASAAPPIRYPNIYGIDMPSVTELVAHDKTVEEVRIAIGADRLMYLDLSALIAAAQEQNPSIQQFESAVFDGVYLTGKEEHYLANVAISRADKDSTPQKREKNHPVDLHNY